MSTSDLLAGLNLVNAGLQCTNQLITDKQAGDENAWNKFFFNMSGSAVRIGMADQMARHGNFFGYTLNSFVPYTDTRANASAMMFPFMAGGLGFWGGPMFMGGCRPFIPFGGFGFGFGHHHHHCHGGELNISIRC